ncbi:hypothetical protein EXIGLDRAFT_729151 [Exidia glandulosa HHB12029]|uniref:F-box domain-containing protein n=1 Tax=Exidia glandulosa HHB12029 TaxID=1314781 RepID=A0A165LKK6_EXIGL|nr:hypothetical protein EXIGLDRAFT_729151 [Exidia glandulosa HHB12029]
MLQHEDTLEYLAQRAADIFRRSGNVSRASSAAALTAQSILAGCTKLGVKRPRLGLLSLPQKLLLSIVERCCLMDRIALSGTCRELRRILLAEPSLWSRIQMDISTLGSSNLDMTRMEELFRRSHPLSGHLALTIDAQLAENDPTYLATLSHLDLSRVESLALDIFNESTQSLDLMLVVYHILGRAPRASRLRSLRLDLRDMENFTENFPDPVVSLDALGLLGEHLTTLNIRGEGVTFDLSTWPIFAHVTTFSLDLDTDEGITSMNEFAVAILRMPSLERLIFYASLMTSDCDDPLDLATEARLTARRLQYAYVGCGGNWAESELPLRLFSKVLWIEDLHLCSEARPRLYKLPPSSQLILGLNRTTLILLDGRRVHFPREDERTTYNNFLYPAFCNNLTSLCIHEYLWMDFASVYSALQLESLTIVLATCFDNKPKTCRIGQADQDAALRARALKVLHIVAPTSKGGRCMNSHKPGGICVCPCPGYIVSLFDIAHFIASCIIRTASIGQLDRVTISGVRQFADPDLGVALDALRAVARDVELIGPARELEAHVMLSRDEANKMPSIIGPMTVTADPDYFGPPIPIRSYAEFDDPFGGYEVITM